MTRTRSPIYEPGKDLYSKVNAVLKENNIRIRQGPLSPSYSDQQIKKVYRTIVRKYHPDVNPASKRWFGDFLGGMEVLVDPENRALYDRAKINYETRRSPNRRQYQKPPQSKDKPKYKAKKTKTLKEKLKKERKEKEKARLIKELNEIEIEKRHKKMEIRRKDQQKKAEEEIEKIKNLYGFGEEFDNLWEDSPSEERIDELYKHL